MKVGERAAADIVSRVGLSSAKNEAGAYATPHSRLTGSRLGLRLLTSLSLADFSKNVRSNVFALSTLIFFRT